ncbi:hypothetical protein HDF24_07990 [Mucilaginibacter sp. X4EP1]|uniref:hypothetical protein n=1 Tax=Mucilaginibacter sp. X4EP1 TaxID=2723092 RepID=UPI002169EE18|nr:hypothetical protein [Mucilaginibacter sp. X4EP1]MCS3813605.1 putative coiled-coil protein SlyX [Mucilaginibacter sp. X4EP1]
MLRIPFIALFICCITSFSYAQDSTKKETPVVKPEVKVKTYKSYPPKVVTSAGQQAVPVKPDTAVPPPPVVTDKSLNGQYQFLLTRVYHYQQPAVADFWKIVTDTLNLGKQKLASAENRLKLQKKTIDSLSGEIAGKDQSISSSGSQLSVFGLLVDKSTYNLVMFGIILVCIAVTVIVVLRSGSKGKEAEYRTTLYNELEEEFKQYKTKANEKEKKLARELQTERNKLDELRGNA